MNGPRFLLDTNVVIGILKGHLPACELLSHNAAVPDVSAVSQITRIELLSHHSLTAEQEARIVALLSSLTVLRVDERIEDATIDLRKRLRLKLEDALIVATARAHGLTLPTLDRQLANAMALP